MAKAEEFERSKDLPSTLGWVGGLPQAKRDRATGPWSQLGAFFLLWKRLGVFFTGEIKHLRFFKRLAADETSGSIPTQHRH